MQLDGTDAVYIYKEESLQNSVRMVSKVGSRIPLYCSAVGKAITADMPREQADSIWKKSRICALTEHTITNYSDFIHALDEVRQLGYALDNEENEIGVRCIAISLPDYKGRAKYAISISAPVSRMPDSRIRQLSQILLNAKQQIITTQGL